MSLIRVAIADDHAVVCEGYRRLLERQIWKFAKTMPQHPHWYTLRATWLSDEAFMQAVEFIREHGKDERWGSRKYRFFRPAQGLSVQERGARVVRVHDVEAVSDFLAVRAALRGERAVPPDLQLDPALRREPVRGRVA